MCQVHDFTGARSPEPAGTIWQDDVWSYERAADEWQPSPAYVRSRTGGRRDVITERYAGTGTGYRDHSERDQAVEHSGLFVSAVVASMFTRSGGRDRVSIPS